jgi:protein-L-isoaspartate(D-aspartate) O-methyltransferase
MADFAAARRMMVDGQIRTNDVTDPRLLSAMLEVPREAFVPRAKRALAYLDLDIAVTEPGQGKPSRCLLKPMTIAKLINAAAIAEGEHVLDVGCGSGYSSALMARLAGSVVALDEDPMLVVQTKEALAVTGVANVEVVTGPLPKGWRAQAPFDAIVVEGAVETPPSDLFAQLRDGGRLVCVLGAGPAGKAMVYRNDGGDISARPVFDAAAPLLGAFAKPPAFVF